MIAQYLPFSRLPREIRTMIWKAAATTSPRIFEVRWRSGTGYTLYNHEASLLQVCKEAREDVFQIYYGTLTQYGQQWIPFNPDRDILYFPFPYSCSTTYGLSIRKFLFKNPQLYGLKNLALCVPPARSWFHQSINELRGGDFVETQKTPNDRINEFYGLDMKFMGNVITHARRSVPNIPPSSPRPKNSSLSLESVTLIVDDPFICIPGADSIIDPVITSSFHDINEADSDLAPELGRLNWKDSATILLWYFDTSFDPDDLPLPRGQADYNNWGRPRVSWKTVSRSSEPSPKWVALESSNN